MVELKSTKRVYAMKVIKKELVMDEEVGGVCRLWGSGRGLQAISLRILSSVESDHVMCLLEVKLEVSPPPPPPRTWTGCRQRSMCLSKPPTIPSWWGCTPASRQTAGQSPSLLSSPLSSLSSLLSPPLSFLHAYSCTASLPVGICFNPFSPSLWPGCSL